MARSKVLCWKFLQTSGLSVCILWSSLFLCITSPVTADVNITFAFMVAQQVNNTPLEQDTSGVIPAVKLALEAINSDPYILPGHYLTYGDELNSECARTPSLDRFFTEITDTPPNKVFLLGCGCSIATVPVGQISHFWEIIHMSYASQAPDLIIRDSYPNFYRTVPSAVEYQDVVMGIMNLYDWTRLVIISQLEIEFNLVTEHLQTALADASKDVSVFTFHSFENVGQQPIFTHDLEYRIYFLNMYSKHARRVICAAYQRDEDTYYPRYVFLTLGWYPSKWWMEESAGNDTLVSCTNSQLEEVLDRSLVINIYPIADNEDGPTDVGKTYNEFLLEYRTELNQTSFVESFAAPFAYDGLWAFVLAVNKTNLTYPLSEFDNEVKSETITAEIMGTLDGLSFTGLTGEVSFNPSTGTRQQSQPRVMQYRFEFSSDPILIGRIIRDNGSDPILMFINNETNDTVWPIIVPFDGSPLTESRTIVLPVFIIMYILATAVVILAVVCAVLNFVFRQRKYIRLTSPNLNYLIVLGCALLTISVYCYTYPALNENVLYGMCIVRAYTQAVGYSLCFGTICAKMWRVYFIFHNPSPNRRTIKDWQLILLVLAACVFDIVYVSLALAFDDYGPVNVPYVESPSDVNEYGIVVEFETLVCNSSASQIWIGFLFFLKFLLQAAAVIFAIRTRKVKIKALNDAKEISVIIYITSVVLTIMVIGVITLDNFRNADAAVFSLGLIVVSTIVLLLLFIPKWYNLYKDPHGENVFERSHSGPSFASGLGHTEHDLNVMKIRIEELEGRLGKYESVTPFNPRRRALSSLNDLSSSLRPGGGRSLTYSPSPLDVTASLPIGLGARIVSPSPGPNSPIIKVTPDSGAGTMNSTTSENDSPGKVGFTDGPPQRNGLSTMKIEEEEVEEDMSSQGRLTFSTEIATSNV